VPEYANIGRLLDDLTGHGIYLIDLVADQFPAFGFTYDPATTTLSYGAGSVRLPVSTKEGVEQRLAKDPRGGIIDPNTTSDELMIDAYELSQAVYRLVVGPVPPGDAFYGMGKGYRANVAAIIATLEAPATQN
jgi:hypothetical protein